MPLSIYWLLFSFTIIHFSIFPLGCSSYVNDIDQSLYEQVGRRAFLKTERATFTKLNITLKKNENNIKE